MARDGYQELTPTERLELLDEVARRRSLPASILEKDYWVCRALDALFGPETLSSKLIFKGGTSLSKVYGLIERFSEDIDVSLHRSYLGFASPDWDPEQATSGKAQRKRLKALEDACREAIADEVLPAMQRRLADELGAADGWSLAIDDADFQTINFFYPRAGATGPDYVKPAVRIEFGARSDDWPAEERQVLAYIGEALDQELGAAHVRVLAAERTFWEKATLLHAEFHRPTEKPMPPRYARHYHDLARMAGSTVAESALADVTLRERVVTHKSIFFSSGWARYEDAKPGSFRLIPLEHRLKELQRDHQAMRQMFFSEPPDLYTVLEMLRELEFRINRAE